MVSASAQTFILEGKVTDKATGLALPGATVLLGNESAMTDLEGGFRIVVTASAVEIELRTTFIGYVPHRRTLMAVAGEVQKVEVGLVADVNALSVAVISASQFERALHTETVSMAVVGEAFITNTNAQDLGQAVQRVPGVIVQDSQVSIRGGNSYSYGVGSRTQVLIDGLSILSPDLGEAQMSLIPLENIAQIEVIKGSSSVIYGSSALNGVVNVITRWPTSATPRINIATFSTLYDNPPLEEQRWWDRQDTRGANGLSGNYEQKLGNLDVVAGGNLYSHRSFLESNDTWRARAHVKTRWHDRKIEGLKYGVNANAQYDRSERFYFARGLEADAYRSAVEADDRYMRATIDPHLSYTDSLGNRHTLDLRYLYLRRYGSGTTIDAISNQATANYLYQKTIRTPIQEGRFTERRIIITPGINANYGFSVSNLYPERHINYFGAMFTQAEFQLDWLTRGALLRNTREEGTRSLSVVGGVRYEVNGIDALVESNIPVFRAGVNLQVAEYTFLRSSVGQSYRIPTIAERFITADLLGISLIANPNLMPERGWNHEFGITQGLKILEWTSYLEFTFFRQAYTNFVEFGAVSSFMNPELFEGLNTFIGFYPTNVDEALITGYEMSWQGKGRIGQFVLTPQVGYTFTFPVDRQKFEASGDDYRQAFVRSFSSMVDSSAMDYLLYMRSRHLVNGDVQIDFRKWSGGMSVYYGSFPEAFQPEFEGVVDLLSRDGSSLREYGLERLDGDLVWDARLAYEVNDQLRVNFIVRNLTNELYGMRPSRPEPVRNFTLQLNFWL